MKFEMHGCTIMHTIFVQTEIAVIVVTYINSKWIAESRFRTATILCISISCECYDIHR